ncbi:hypothetical protein D3C73_1111920 [compost metagenome]
MDPVDFRNDIDRGVVVQKLFVHTFAGAVQVDIHQHTGLDRIDDHPLLLHQFGQERHHLIHPCFDQYDRIIRIRSRIKDNVNGGLAGAGCICGDITHALHPVDGIF